MINLSATIEKRSITFNFGGCHTETVIPYYSDIAHTSYFINRLVGFDSATRSLSFKHPYIRYMMFMYGDNQLECVISGEYTKKFSIDKQSAIDTFKIIVDHFKKNNCFDDNDNLTENNCLSEQKEFKIPTKLTI